MGTIIFIIAAIMLVSLTIYLSLRKKESCPFCNSRDIVKTGNKIYKENPGLAVFGSPDSYHQLEYKCNSCGKTFFIDKKAVIIN